MLPGAKPGGCVLILKQRMRGKLAQQPHLKILPKSSVTTPDKLLLPQGVRDKAARKHRRPAFPTFAHAVEDRSQPIPKVCGNPLRRPSKINCTASPARSTLDILPTTSAPVCPKSRTRT